MAPHVIITDARETVQKN